MGWGGCLCSSPRTLWRGRRRGFPGAEAPGNLMRRFRALGAQFALVGAGADQHGAAGILRWWRFLLRAVLVDLLGRVRGLPLPQALIGH